MPRKFLKRYMPDHDKIRQHKHLNQIFGTLLHDPNLLHLNRRSVSGAFAVGLFMTFVPVPFQMVLAAGTAIWLRVNLPLSVGLVWISNPITIPPILFFCYKLGSWILGTELQEVEFEITLGWLLTLDDAILPVLLGSFLMSVVSSALGYGVVRLLWRLHVIAHWKERRQLRKNKLK